jgi:hypothetical protein
VKLDEIDLVRAQALERTLHLGDARIAPGDAQLGGEKDALPCARAHGREQVPEPTLVPDNIREILRPEDDSVDRIRGEIDLDGPAPGPDEGSPPGAQDGRKPIREESDEVGAPRGADDGFQGLIPAGGKAGRRSSPRGRT